jgi:hypothetical protein
MAVRFETSAPKNLLERVKKLIDDGVIAAWSYDKDGDFTHTSERWSHRAWLRPSVGDGRLSFYILAPKETTISRAVYAVYHSRFIEAVLTNCDDDFTRAVATAMPEGKDIIRGSS